MGPIVVDASLTLSWCFADEATPYRRSVLTTLETTYAVVPALRPLEVANVLTLAERRQRITQAGIIAFMDKLQRLPIQIERRGGALAMAGGDPPRARASAERLRCCVLGIGEA